MAAKLVFHPSSKIVDIKNRPKHVLTRQRRTGRKTRPWKRPKVTTSKKTWKETTSKKTWKKLTLLPISLKTANNQRIHKICKNQIQESQSRYGHSPWRKPWTSSSRKGQGALYNTAGPILEEIIFNCFSGGWKVKQGYFFDWRTLVF